MAAVRGPTEIEAIAGEVYTLELTDEEKSALRASPERFVRKLLEEEGHTVNGILIDTRLFEEDGCPSQSYEVFHLLAPPHRRSEYELRCVPLM